jgi:hypothetical protein
MTMTHAELRSTALQDLAGIVPNPSGAPNHRVSPASVRVARGVPGDAKRSPSVDAVTTKLDG